MRFKKSMLVGFFSAGIFFLFIVSSALAQEETDPVNGWYVGLSLPITAVMGEFSGDKAFVENQGTVFIPEIDPGVGLGFTLGAREANLAFEFSYIRSFHRGKSQAGSGDVRLNLMNFDLKFFGRLDEKLQPFFLVGGTIPRLFFEDGSVSGISVEEVKFSGFGLNLGGGVSYFYSPRISFVLGLTYRIIRYDSVSGVGDGSYDIGSFSGDSITINPKIMYSF